MLYHVYCDESRQSKERYMLIGGLIIEARDVLDVDNSMAIFRANVNMHAEFKWSKVSNQKAKEYERLIRYFFRLIQAEAIHFYSLILDTHQFDHRKFNEGDKELGFYKFYYQLLLHCFGKHCYNDDDRLMVYLDARSSSYPLPRLKTILNYGIRKKYKMKSMPVLTIEPRDSKSSALLQINDLILGGLGYIKNRHFDAPDAKLAKVYLSNLILQEAGIRNLDRDFWGYRFRVWNFRLRK